MTTKSLRSKIIYYYSKNQDLSQTQVSKDLNLPISIVHLVCKASPKLSTFKYKRIDNKKKEIQKLFDEGYSMASVAKKYGVTRQAIDSFAKRNSLINTAQKKDLLAKKLFKGCKTREEYAAKTGFSLAQDKARKLPTKYQVERMNYIEEVEKLVKKGAGRKKIIAMTIKKGRKANFTLFNKLGVPKIRNRVVNRLDYKAIKQFMKKNPEYKQYEVAKVFGVTPGGVSACLKNNK